MKKNQQIRNSTAEYLIFAMQGDAEGIEVRLEDDTVWLTQQMLASLYGRSRTNVLEHIQHIYADEELEESATCRKIRQVQKEGNRNVNRETLFYNLDIIIAVGYRVNSKRATQFRQWATAVLRDFAIRGYVLDRKPANKICVPIASAEISNHWYPNLIAGNALPHKRQQIVARTAIIKGRAKIDVCSFVFILYVSSFPFYLVSR